MKSLVFIGVTTTEAESTPKLPTTAPHTYRALTGGWELPMVTSRAQHRAASVRSMNSERETTQNGMDELSSICLDGRTSSVGSWT
jgi:hypothetical protein